MLITEHEIESSLDRARLWDELVSLETISQWSALEDCASTDSTSLQASASYVCTHSTGDDGVDATVQVTCFDVAERLTLHTSTAIADLDERLVLTDRGTGSLVSYSADATSGSFGPAANTWLRHHVNVVCDRLNEFANPVHG